jgi:hypothetical protein
LGGSVTNTKEQIVASVRQIDELNRGIAEHWSMVQKHILTARVDEAISVLNAYFRLQAKLEQVEGSLKSTLHSYFSDK